MAVGAADRQLALADIGPALRKLILAPAGVDDEVTP
jgi:hypothetical protein